MSVSFTYKPVDTNNGTDWGKGSELRAVMRTAFGSYPMILTSASIPVLHGILACGFTDVTKLIEAISVYGTIQIFENY